MNLPPDADDLSRHAPTLLSLKNKGEVFIVPALYFEELSELVISKTAIPSESGLVVPENYFEESAGLIISKTNLPVESGLTEPENYFEEFTSLIEAKVNLPEESGLTEPQNYFESLSANIEAEISLENALPKAEEEIPTDYFSEMERELHVHIALDNVKQDEGFLVPEGYFGNLADRVLAKTVAAGAESEEVAASEDPNVPEKYFEEFPEKVLARIESESGSGGKVIVFAQWKRVLRPVAIAASVALLIGTGWFFLGNNGNNNAELASVNYARIIPDQVNDGNITSVDPIDTTKAGKVEIVADPVAKKPKDVKPPQENAVIIIDDAIIAQTDLMDEGMVMDFVVESNVLEETEEVLDPAMMEYLMKDHSGFDVFDPTE